MVRLTLQELDNVSSLAFAGMASPGHRRFLAAELRAYMEWYWLRRSGHLLGSLTKTGRWVEFHRNLCSARSVWTTPEQPARGFVKVRRHHTDSQHLEWTMFRYELHRAAVAAGFDTMWAAQIVGALGELEDNIHWHSQAAESGVLAYWVTDHLDCVLLDGGVGVLASLRRNEEYRQLSDHGTALRLATTNGISRHGSGSGRGWGYNDLFVGLANSNADIRFRSGDHLLSVKGRSGLPTAQLHQRATGEGLLVSIRVSRTRG